MPGLQVNPVLCFDIFRRILYGCQVLFYLWAGIKMVSAYQERVDHFYSNSAVRSINWVKALNFSLLVAAALSMIFNVAGRNMFMDKPSLMMIPSILFLSPLFCARISGKLAEPGCHRNAGKGAVSGTDR